MLDSLFYLYTLASTSQNKNPTTWLMIFSALHALAFFLSYKRAQENKELLTNALTIGVISIKDVITSISYVVAINSIKTPDDIYTAQHIYGVMAAINIAALVILYKLHLKYAYTFGRLFFYELILTGILIVFRTVTWVKYRYFESYYEPAYYNLMYEIVIFCVVLLQCIVMFSPEYPRLFAWLKGLLKKSPSKS
ncbi:hypothetical protein KO527_05215 [Pseudoalteromonas sp. C2R02]|uniref:hypothetical protein n=1 Tax=Pseudoalteromonas sp. C2R02 TaxID=2841565 RepID=UPI001C09CF7D|nr:hypothetical protein [Pseudoalteromonas sp. C2R02]MBU2968747.1 hypothetical protein [Pseudoalteromonas sp. C2R02]